MTSYAKSHPDSSPSVDSIDVTVLVPVLDEEAHLRASAEAMGSQKFDGTIEFLLIDGGSRDRTPQLASEIAGRDERFRLLENPARRTPNALNIGLRQAKGRFVVRMDAHTLYPSDYIARAVARLEQGDVAWVSGPQLAHGNDSWSRRVALALKSPLGIGGATFRKELEEEIETDSGFAGMARRDLLEQLGGWDEAWPVNQDGELAARIRKAGGRIVCVPDMAANYVPRNSLPALSRQYWRYGQFRVKTSRRHPESLRPSHVIAPALALTTLLAVLPGRVGRLPRAGLCLYVVAVAREARRISTPRLRETAAVAAVFPTMHLSWGFGFLRGCARFGIPWRGAVSAVRRLTRRRAGADRA
jgi:succinoglycan biosynthesis protein ExoA